MHFTTTPLGGQTRYLDDKRSICMKFCCISIAFFFTFLQAQTVSGTWVGEVWQAGSTDTFSYQIQLQQQGEAITGEAYTKHNGGEIEARFLLSGRLNNDQLTLQEIEQLSPDAPQWCLKYIQLHVKANEIAGEWTATGCKPGLMSLRRTGPITKERPFSYIGRWTGYLDQSDRNHGFYFELSLAADGTGTSHIVSEGAGGEATHALTWSADDNKLQFAESEVIDRTEGAWRWCIKHATLLYDRQAASYQLEGDWSGHIEGTDVASGGCAPGQLHLTKPVLTDTVRAHIAPQTDIYTADTKRAIRVDRVIKVQAELIRIKVWDNGIVDGDVLTLFLNGKRILKNYRVNKRKWSIPVDILEGENLLILHAEDLGDISPNTVAVSIDDGVKEQVVIMSSNLDESGAILIQPFELE